MRNADLHGCTGRPLRAKEAGRLRTQGEEVDGDAIR